VEYYICLELGGTNLRYGIVDSDYSLREFHKLSSTGLADAANKVDYLAGLMGALIDKVGKNKCLAVTMALSSLMDKERTTVYSSPMVKGFNNIPLAPLLSTRLGLPVYLEKDVNILLLYELGRLSVKPEGIDIGVFIGTGLGNAMCIDGRVYRGANGAACELGHIPVAGFSGKCDCGKDGCIELKASGHVLGRLAVEKYACPVTRIFADHGSEDDVLDIVNHCALAIATEITLLDPVHLILGGGVVNMEGFPFDYLLARIKDNLRIPNPRDTLDVIRASGEEQAGVVGAAINASQLRWA
jgi:allose kinase